MPKFRTSKLAGAINIFNPRLFDRISLAAFLAWVGLGSDALSSSAYGPPALYAVLRGHEYLSVILAIAIPLTVFIISAGYKQVIALFPEGGGGYHTATTLLGSRAGLVSGAALIVDYILTAAVSVASGTDAVLSLASPSLYGDRLLLDIAVLLFIVFLNLRGMKDSIKILLPIFLAFVLTHAVVLGFGLLSHAESLPALVSHTASGITKDHRAYGWIFIVALLFRAFSMGGGTYTGLEAVANGVHIMREPRVDTAQRTMTYLAVSLSLVASSLILLYLMYHVQPQAHETLNASLYRAITIHWQWGHIALGPAAVFLTLITEGLLLFVAANTGVITAPIVMANMAVDRWLPKRFSYLSDSFVSRNGVLLVGFSAIAIMVMARGHVGILVVLYSINVFITFALTMAGLTRHWYKTRRTQESWRSKIFISTVGLIVTASILVITVYEKFDGGGWFTLLITALLIFISVRISRHYKALKAARLSLDDVMADLIPPADAPIHPIIPVSPNERTAVFFVNGFDGLGIHTYLSVKRMLGDYIKNYVFLMAGVVGEAEFKGIEAVQHLRTATEAQANRYLAMCRNHDVAATWFTAYSTDRRLAMLELSQAAIEAFPQSLFFSGRLVDPALQTRFRYILHDDIGFVIQDYIERDGFTMTIVPVNLHGIVVPTTPHSLDIYSPLKEPPADEGQVP
ncbi:MAG TPA: APC family permease [Acidiferrobacter sp.]|nr:APC family permease [Acidiferrobacter sp.]